MTLDLESQNMRLVFLCDKEELMPAGAVRDCMAAWKAFLEPVFYGYFTTWVNG